jgi:hypothetical protein
MTGHSAIFVESQYGPEGRNREDAKDAKKIT